MTETVDPQPGFTVERTGERQYAAKSERGSELVIGYGPGEFSPGDLLKLAILGCNALSSEARFTRVLGEDCELTGRITSEYLKSEDRFTEFTVELNADLSALYPEDREQLLERAAKAVQRYCTISHTVEKSAVTHLTIDGTEV
ncbi:OsmC family protein [Actinomyces minihominis]|uniref:OsmC family protein n=1 Tax=Actinomyces minihominis TaxID=2002838 RepID=UPI001F5C5474|nr:OsmC family protein [Actinomyces minihominis]